MTSYEKVYEKFLDKIKNDTDFFIYNGLTEADRDEVINKRLFFLLDSAVNYLISRCSPEVDFSDKDDLLLQFNFDLVNIEIELLADIMRFKFFEEDQLKLKAMMNYVGDDLKIYSPARERNSFNSMLLGIEQRVEKQIDSYSSKDRLTNKPKFLSYDV